MKVNADFRARAAQHFDAMDWVPSPMRGVERKMLDRVGEEVARATSIVRYAPGSSFSPHKHDGGEEFLVLEGVFQDEHGDFPAGSYVRNPPGSCHRPISEQGCTIFVKLWQFAHDDLQHVVTDTDTLTLVPLNDVSGIKGQLLHETGLEKVRIESWTPSAKIDLIPRGGLELLCLKGEFQQDDENFRRYSWLRLPAGAPLRAQAGPEGCRIWLKEGHLSGFQTTPQKYPA